MKAKNYIVTSKGFVVGMQHDENGSELITTTILREACTFSTKTAKAFMERNEVEGFVWKPFKEQSIVDGYTVKKIHRYSFEESDDTIEEWQPIKITMTSDSDADFLLKGKLESDDAMTFEEAKAEALRRNAKIFGELVKKIENIRKLEKDNCR